MKKKVLLITIILIILVVISICLFSCSIMQEQKDEVKELSERFTIVKGSWDGISIMVDKETKVCYYRERFWTGAGVSGKGYGFMTVLLHADGTPILWIDGEMK